MRVSAKQSGAQRICRLQKPAPERTAHAGHNSLSGASNCGVLRRLAPRNCRAPAVVSR